ncbi:MAG: hypothetical protein QM655_12085 [Nocardioidaceae bacterium]
MSARSLHARNRRVLLLVALVGLFAPLLVVAGSVSANSAARGVATASLTRATAGQWIVFSGKVPTGDKRTVIVQRRWAGKWVNPVRGTSTAAGNYSVRVRMMAMPTEYFSVYAPKAGKRKAWRSKTFKIVNAMQDVTLTSNSDRFTAKVTPAVAGRSVTLQRQAGPAEWQDLGTTRTGAKGKARFDYSPGAGEVYRAVAAGWHGISIYPSFPLFVDPPALDAEHVSDPAASGVLKPQPSSSWSAAAKYKWWPANGFWDMEQGEGLKPWTEYATGTARLSVFTGQLSIETRAPGRGEAFGDASSTLGISGYARGRWEIKVHAPQFATGLTPYTTRVSLVPAGTPDGVTPDKRIVLGQWRGYSSKTKIAIGTGAGELQRTVSGIKQNRRNWHNLAVQITGKKITWIIDRKVVGQSGGAATKGTAWVPRLEMIGVDGKVMNRSRGGIDWVRYFTLDRRHDVTLPSGPVLK